jgi:Flp pilus assembly protein TadB
MGRNISVRYRTQRFDAHCGKVRSQGFLKEFMTMQTKGKKLVLLLLGWGFVALGVVGLFLPVLQGVLFLLIGLFLLSSEYVWAHRLLEKIRNRFPAAALRCEEASRKAHNWLGKVFRRGSRPGTE